MSGSAADSCSSADCVQYRSVSVRVSVAGVGVSRRSGRVWAVSVRSACGGSGGVTARAAAGGATCSAPRPAAPHRSTVTARGSSGMAAAIAL